MSVCGGKGGIGKSFVGADPAIASAQAGRQTVVVDLCRGDANPKYQRKPRVPSGIAGLDAAFAIRMQASAGNVEISIPRAPANSQCNQLDEAMRMAPGHEIFRARFAKIHRETQTNTPHSHENSLSAQPAGC